MDLIRQNVERHMTELCLKIGSRHIGSPGEAAAANYIEQQFKAAGYTTVRETYPVTGWDFQSMEFINLTQHRPVPNATTCFFSNSVEAEGKLLWLTQTELQNLENIPVQGRICMVENRCNGGNVFSRNKIAEDLDRLGATAAIFLSNIHTALAPSTKIQRSPFLKHLGALAVAQEGAFDLARHKNDLYRIVIKARNFPHTSANIVARQQGNGGPRCVIGGHYDTAPNIQGAGDNATGTVMVMELARLVKGKYPQIPMDFVTFSSEEYIPEILPPGSGNYLDRHLKEGLRWFMNFDDIGLLIGTPEIQVGLQEKLPPFHPVSVPFVPAEQNSDDKGFFLAGIPTVYYYDRNPFGQLHTVCDSLDTIDFDKMTFILKDAMLILDQLLANG